MCGGEIQGVDRAGISLETHVSKHISSGLLCTGPSAFHFYPTKRQCQACRDARSIPQGQQGLSLGLPVVALQVDPKSQAAPWMPQRKVRAMSLAAAFRKLTCWLCPASLRLPRGLHPRAPAGLQGETTSQAGTLAAERTRITSPLD